MSGNDIAKWVFTFALLAVTVGWGWFCVNTILAAISQPTAVDIIVAAGVGSLMGALISWNALVVQHWFRKKAPE